MNLSTARARLNWLDLQKEKLSSRIKVRSERIYSALPKELGLRTIDELIILLAPNASLQLRRRLGDFSPRTVSDTATTAAEPSRKRKRLSSEERIRLRAESETGDKTNAQLAAEFGISSQGVQIWKARWGLTKRRKPASA